MGSVMHGASRSYLASATSVVVVVMRYVACRLLLRVGGPRARRAAAGDDLDQFRVIGYQPPAAISARRSSTVDASDQPSFGALVALCRARAHAVMRAPASNDERVAGRWGQEWAKKINDR
ncbi:MAG: hypothetical protein ACJ74O_17895 [Frankiaceae bacterium]